MVQAHAGVDAVVKPMALIHGEGIFAESERDVYKERERVREKEKERERVGEHNLVNFKI